MFNVQKIDKKKMNFFYCGYLFLKFIFILIIIAKFQEYFTFHFIKKNLIHSKSKILMLLIVCYFTSMVGSITYSLLIPLLPIFSENIKTETWIALARVSDMKTKPNNNVLLPYLFFSSFFKSAVVILFSSNRFCSSIQHLKVV